MGIGAQDYIDQLLVKKYALEKVDNINAMTSVIQPEQVMSAMNNLASVSRNMFELNRQLNSACYALNAMSATYREADILQ